MGYRVELSSEAQDDLSGFDRQVQSRIVKKLFWLADQGNPTHCLKRLHGKDTHNSRFRIGDYRVILSIHTKENVILVTRIGHRRDVYR